MRKSLGLDRQKEKKEKAMTTTLKILYTFGFCSLIGGRAIGFRETYNKSVANERANKEISHLKKALVVASQKSDAVKPNTRTAGYPSVESYKKSVSAKNAHTEKSSNSMTLKAAPCDTIKIEIHDTVPPHCPAQKHDSVFVPLIHKLKSKPATHE